MKSELVRTPVIPNLGTYPGKALRLGDVNEDVRTIQLRLNRISTNYPLIPKIYPVNRAYDNPLKMLLKYFSNLWFNS